MRLSVNQFGEHSAAFSVVTPDRDLLYRSHEHVRYQCTHTFLELTWLRCRSGNAHVLSAFNENFVGASRFQDSDLADAIVGYHDECSMDVGIEYLLRWILCVARVRSPRPRTDFITGLLEMPANGTQQLQPSIPDAPTDQIHISSAACHRRKSLVSIVPHPQYAPDN